MFKRIGENDPLVVMLKIIKDNCSVASTIRSRIKRLESLTSSQEKKPITLEDSMDSMKTPVISNIEMDEVCIEDPEYNNRLNSIIIEYRKLSNPTKEELLNILPEIDSYDFTPVIYRLIIESRKEIITMTKLKVEAIKASEDVSDINTIDEIIESEKSKIRLLEDLLNEEIRLEEKEEDNKDINIILAPNQKGEIPVLEDINTKNIPMDYYNDIYKAIQKISGNTIKGKQLKTRALVNAGGYDQKRSNAIRVIFKRLNKNTYAILYIFTKDFQTSTIYRERLVRRIKDYMGIEPKIIANLDNPGFLEANVLNVEELFNKLMVNGQVAKKLVKQ